MPYLKLAAVASAEGLSLFALNRSLDQELEFDLAAKGFAGLALEEALELRGELEAVNTKDQPDRIKPRPMEGVAVEGQRLRATLAPASWNLIRLAAAP